jgi:hypothetical protein
MRISRLMNGRSRFAPGQTQHLKDSEKSMDALIAVVPEKHDATAFTVKH